MDSPLHSRGPSDGTPNDGSSNPPSQPPNPAPPPDIFADAAGRRRRTGVMWLATSGLVLVVGVGGWLGFTAYQRRTVPPVAVSTVAVIPTDLETQVAAEGTVSLGGQQTLNAPSEVTVQQVLVGEGQAVVSGQVLLELRDRQLQNDLDQARIDLQIQQLTYQRTLEKVAESERTVQREEEELAESAALLADEFISEDEYNRDRNDLEAAQVALRDAQVEQQTARLRLEQAQTNITNLEARLQDNVIRAPFDAVVLDVAVSSGEGVNLEGALLTLGDPKKETILFSLPTLEAIKVRPGMAMRAFVVGPNPVKYPGRLVDIAPQARSGEGSNGPPVVQVLAALDQPSGVLIPGSAVSLEIITDSRPQALAVSPQALQTEGDTTYLWIRDDQGRARRREVTTGLETLDQVEIVSGLAEGDAVIVNVPTAPPLTEGMPIADPNETPSDGEGE